MLLSAECILIFIKILHFMFKVAIVERKTIRKRMLDLCHLFDNVIN